MAFSEFMGRKRWIGSCRYEKYQFLGMGWPGGNKKCLRLARRHSKIQTSYFDIIMSGRLCNLREINLIIFFQFKYIGTASLSEQQVDPRVFFEIKAPVSSFHFRLLFQMHV